jgi:hypothetical protein
MVPVNQSECAPDLARLRAYAASGIKTILELAEYLHTENATLPDELRPLWQALTDMTIRTLTESYVECLMMLSELGLQEITRAAQGNQKTVPSVGCPAQQEAAENNGRE